MNGSCGLIELCCDMMLGPSYCVHNNGFVMFPHLHLVNYTVTEFYSGFRLLSSRMVCYVALLIVVWVLMSLRVLVCISVREYYVVVSYTLNVWWDVPCNLPLNPLACLNVNDGETLLMDVVLWCVHSVSNGVTSSCFVNWLTMFLQFMRIVVSAFDYLYISLRVLCGCFIGSNILFQA